MVEFSLVDVCVEGNLYTLLKNILSISNNFEVLLDEASCIET